MRQPARVTIIYFSLFTDREDEKTYSFRNDDFNKMAFQLGGDTKVHRLEAYVDWMKNGFPG